MFLDWAERWSPLVFLFRVLLHCIFPYNGYKALRLLALIHDPYPSAFGLHYPVLKSTGTQPGM